MIRALCTLLLGLVGVYAALFALQVGFTRFYAPTGNIPPGAHVVVLSHTYMYQLRPRTQAGAALFHETGAQSLIVSGQNIAPLMAEMATAQGVPGAQIKQEPNARSTLQNALFVRDVLAGDDGPVVLVSDQSHLLRAWASFRWAGFSDIHLRASTPPRWDIRGSASEAGKWIYNLPRMATASALHALGLPQDRYVRLLD